MKPQKKSKPSEPINLSRWHLLKTAAVATPFFIAGGATELLQGAGKSVENVIELGARAAVEHIRQGHMKAEFYLSQLLKQYNAHKDLNAVVTIDEARMLEEARAVDKREPEASGWVRSRVYRSWSRIRSRSRAIRQLRAMLPSSAMFPGKAQRSLTS